MVPLCCMRQQRLSFSKVIRGGRECGSSFPACSAMAPIIPALFVETFPFAKKLQVIHSNSSAKSDLPPKQSPW